MQALAVVQSHVNLCGLLNPGPQSWQEDNVKDEHRLSGLSLEKVPGNESGEAKGTRQGWMP